MMKVNELRIGNYVYDEFNRLCQIKTIGLESVRLLIVEGGTDFNSKEISQCKTCTLTEEWLLKFPKWFADLIKDGFYNYSNGTDTKYIDIEFVHSAQNLLFALTGKELEIKD